LISEEASTEDYSGNYACASMHEAIFRFAQYAWDNASHDNVIAFGTILIAIFTYVLYRSTDKLWEAGERQRLLSEDTAKRQLRPYIIIKGKDITEQDDTHGRFVHLLKVVNAGQTPAYHLRGITRLRVLDHPISRDFDFIIPPGDNQSVMMLGPRQSTGHNSYADETLTPRDLIRVKSNGPWRLYNYGTFTYEDSFGTEYRTNFCYFFDFTFFTDMATGENSSVTALQATPHHNDAT
jgi:hypothetical protein